MFILELFDAAAPGYHDEKSDNSVARMTDSRQRSRLTLAHLNRLRQSHDVRKLEHEKKLGAVSKQYTPPADPGAMPGVM